MTLVTLLHIFLCFILHVRPPISLCKGSVRQGSTSCVASTNLFMYSSISSSDASGCMHSKYDPEKERLYNFWSSNSQNRGAFLHTLSAFNFSSSKISSLRNKTIESIQLGLTLIWWIWTTAFFILVGLHRSSTRITRDRLCAEEVGSVDKESA